MALLIDYNNTSYIDMINTFNGCDGYHVYESFQYKCLEDSALLMAAIGILFSFNYIKNPTYLALELTYTKCSWKFLGRWLITLVLPAIVAAIFLNPLWTKISVKVSISGMALIIWAI